MLGISSTSLLAFEYSIYARHLFAAAKVHALIVDVMSGPTNLLGILEKNIEHWGSKLASNSSNL